MGSGSESSNIGLHDLIVDELSRVILRDLHVTFGTIKEELVAIMDEHIRT